MPFYEVRCNVSWLLYLRRFVTVGTEGLCVALVLGFFCIRLQSVSLMLRRLGSGCGRWNGEGLTVEDLVEDSQTRIDERLLSF